uniref:Uncharacterized protein n=1 Tax=Oryza barthii TaxID=65489 RepID=A0A0D3FVA6_9ORYZ
MGTAKNPIGFRCNECMKKDSSLHDQNQHMTNVPTDRSTCLKESSDNPDISTHGCIEASDFRWRGSSKAIRCYP